MTCQIGWDSVMRMSLDLRDLFLYEAFLYYNPLLLVVSQTSVLTLFLRDNYSVNNINISFVVFVYKHLQTAAVWFWGANLWVFAQSNVNYSKIFDLDQNHLTYKEIWKVNQFIIIIMVILLYRYMYVITILNGQILIFEVM